MNPFWMMSYKSTWTFIVGVTKQLKNKKKPNNFMFLNYRMYNRTFEWGWRSFWM